MSDISYTTNLTPLRQRKHQVFLSHAHVDLEAISRLKNWLELAGLSVWFDRDRVQGGKIFPKALAAGINECSALIVAISESSIRSDWVEQEFNHGLVHQSTYPSFPVIPVRLDGAQIPIELGSLSAVDAMDGFLTQAEAAKLLRSIHGLPDLTPASDLKMQVVQQISNLAGEGTSPLERVRAPILYVTCGWRATKNETFMRTKICERLAREGFQLIGDADDHPRTDHERIEALMKGCSGHLILLGRRSNATSIDGDEYRSIRAEIEMGKTAGLAQYCVHEIGLTPPTDLAASIGLNLADDDSKSLKQLLSWTSELQIGMISPIHPAFVFVATDYEDLVVKEEVVRHISQVTGLPCLRGTDFAGQSPSRKIEVAIRLASLVISNVVSRSVSPTQPDVNWNTCIEAGIALGAKTPIQIIARRQAGDTWTIREKLPFMLRDHSIGTYMDDQQLMALIHKIVRPFRRRILGAN